MKDGAETIKDGPVLMDRRADYFGTEGTGFELRTSIRGSGVLALYEDRLTFDQYLTNTHIEIPLEEISQLGVGLWHKMKTKVVPVLKVTYRRNLVFGVAVAEPERWIAAIEEISARCGPAPRVDRRAVPTDELVRVRVWIGAILALVIFLTVVLPIFLGKVNRIGVREVDTGDPSGPVDERMAAPGLAG